MERRRARAFAVGSLVAVWALVLAGGGACATTDCTEIGCSDHAVVSFPFDLIDGPYDLVVQTELGTLMARCLQPGAPEAEQNSPELSCDAMGYEVDGGMVASAREAVVTITDVDTGEVLADGIAIDLNVVDEQQPNGPDCPPTCFVRNGELRVDDGE